MLSNQHKGCKGFQVSFLLLDKEKDGIMVVDRRKEKRRHGDRVLIRTVEILHMLEKISSGKEADYTEYYADLVGVKDMVGRRQTDRKLGDTLCSTIANVAANIHGLLARAKALRKVRITKMRGKIPSRVAVRASVVGWEAKRPRVGKKYRLYKDDGGVFRSALVTEVKPGFFQTRNSLYRVEVLESA
jgi:hypothetical protein